MMKSKHSSGFSLLELMIVAAMLGGLGVVVMSITKQSNKSSTKFQFDSESTQILNEITGILSSQSKCLATLGGKNALSDTTLSSINGNQYYMASHSSAPAAGYGNGGVKIDSYSINATTSDIDANTSWLSVVFQNKKILGGQSTITKKIKLNVTVDGSKIITACYAVASGSASSQWTTAGSGIFYSSGNVGVGVDTPTSPLDVVTTNNGGIKIRMSTSDASPASLQFTNNIGGEVASILADSTNNLRFSTNTTEALRITSAGNVGIGVFPPVNKLDVNGNVKATIFFGTSFQYTSDQRLKKNIEKLKNGSTILNRLRPVRFNWKVDNKADIGFIAQEVERELPEITSQDSSGIKRVDYAKLIPILVKTIQEQQKRLEFLEKKFNEN